MRSRYDADGHEAGSNGTLANKHGITDPDRLSNLETILLNDAYAHFLNALKNHELVFDVKLLVKIHEQFLSPLYSWAGKFRTVDISKGNTLFASCRFIPELLKEFDKQLRKHLPKKDDSKKDISVKLSYIHNELNAIHPFREGNGRTLRLFLDLLAIDTGYEPINYSASNMKSYFDACKAGMVGNNKPMERFIYKGLTKRK
ncbi:MAG: Fic/DOC family protein [Candidatus Altimarinota bacterium]